MRTSNVPTTTGERLVSLRDTFGMSQAQVASTIGVDRTSYAKYEKNVNKPTRKLKELSTLFNVTSDYIMGLSDDPHGTKVPEGKGFYESFGMTSQDAIIHSYKIPILGRVAAGIPIDAHEEILGYQYINEKYRNDGYNYFALRISGKSMEPTIMDGDIVIVRQQPTVDSGDIAIVFVDGEDATVKEVKESPDGITLIGHNVAVYTPHFYSNKDIQELPVQIIGRVMQTIREF